MFNEISPLVSIVLPVNRDDGYFDEAIESVLNQTYKNFEFIIIANNCADKLWEKTLEFKNRDSRVVAYRLDLGGLVFALNYGIEKAKGKYIARMDADDICYSERIFEQVKFLENNKNIDILGTQITLIDESSKVKNEKSSILAENMSEIIKISSYKCPLYHPTVMFRKDKILSLGGYKFAFYGEDYELWLRCIHNGLVLHNLKNPLLYYRVHASQLSQFNNKKNKFIKLIMLMSIWIYKRYSSWFGFFIQGRIAQYLIVKTSSIRQFFR